MTAKDAILRREEGKRPPPPPVKKPKPEPKPEPEPTEELDGADG